jgi:hypothetical protein
MHEKVIPIIKLASLMNRWVEIPSRRCIGANIVSTYICFSHRQYFH